jgi:alkylhydroperoxidase family enzyme
MTWLPVDTNDRSDGEAVFGLVPDAASTLFDFMATADALVDAELMGLCRARIAQLLRYEPALAEVDRDLLAALEAWDVSERFGERERALLDYLEQFMIAPIEVTAAQREELSRHLGAGFTTFVNALYLQEAYLRFLAFFDIRTEPAALRAAASPIEGEAVDGYLRRSVEQQAWELDERYTDALLAYGAAICRHHDVGDYTDEVVRLRSADYHGCQFCKSVRRKVDWPDGVQDLMDEANRGKHSDALGRREKLGLELLDQFLVAPGAVDEALRARLLDEFGPTGIVELALKEVFWMSNKPMISLGTDIGAVDPSTLTEFEYDAEGNFTLLGPRASGTVAVS